MRQQHRQLGVAIVAMSSLALSSPPAVLARYARPANDSLSNDPGHMASSARNTQPHNQHAPLS